MATDNHTDMSINSTNAEFGGLEGAGIGTEGERAGTGMMGVRRKVRKEGFYVYTRSDYACTPSLKLLFSCCLSLESL